MIDKKYIYLGSFFLFLIIIKFINPPIIQKISFINYDFYQKVFNRDEVKDLTIVDIDEMKITKGIAIQPNQNPITDSNFASPNPIPSLFLKTL